MEVRCGGHATTREKNRQAQQRFRQRQKDRIHELEAVNRALQEQVRCFQLCHYFCAAL